MNHFSFPPRYLAALVVCLFVGHISLSAQTTAKSLAGHGGSGDATVMNLEEEDGTWSFFLDEQSQVYFIDFESLPVTLSEIIVKDQKGKVKMEDDVSALPVNTIYELSYSDLSPGIYDVELHSYSKIMRRRIIVH